MPKRGFTLTEMLVVLGILALLIGILIPTLITAQRAAKKTQCMSRINEISRSLQTYLNDYDNYLPPAGTTNGGNTLGNPKTLANPPFSLSVQKGAGRGVMGDDKKWAEELGGVEKYIGPPGFPYSVPPLAYFLKSYIKPKKEIWQCPASPRNAFRISALAELGQDDGIYGALAGIQPEDSFVPTYRYMGTAEYWFGIHWEIYPYNNFLVPRGLIKSNSALDGRWHAFLARNIGGLRINNLITVSKQPQSSIVTLFEDEATYHNREEGSFYGGRGELLVFDGKRAPILDLTHGKWGLHMAYLDGHVEYKTFQSEPEFFSLLHDEIPQRWGFVQLLDRAHMKFPWQRIGKDPMR